MSWLVLNLSDWDIFDSCWTRVWSNSSSCRWSGHIPRERTVPGPCGRSVWSVLWMKRLETTSQSSSTCWRNLPFWRLVCLCLHVYTPLQPVGRVNVCLSFPPCMAMSHYVTRKFLTLCLCSGLCPGERSPVCGCRAPLRATMAPLCGSDPENRWSLWQTCQNHPSKGKGGLTYWVCKCLPVHSCDRLTSILIFKRSEADVEKLVEYSLSLNSTCHVQNISWLLWIHLFQVYQWDKEPAVSTQSQWAQGDAVWGPDESPRWPHRSGVRETNYCCCRCAEGCALRRGVSTQWHPF